MNSKKIMGTIVVALTSMFFLSFTLLNLNRSESEDKIDDTGVYVCFDFDASCMEPYCEIEICVTYSYCEVDGNGDCIPGTEQSNYLCHTFTQAETYCFDVLPPAGKTLIDGSLDWNILNNSTSKNTSLDLDNAPPCGLDPNQGQALYFIDCTPNKFFLCKDEDGNYVISCDFFQ